MIDEFKMPPFLRQIIVIAVIFVALMGMKYSSEILGPILLSIFLSIIIYPFLIWLKKKGLSYNLSVIITLVGTLALGAAIIGFLVVTLAELVKTIPTITIDPSGFLAQYGDQIITIHYRKYTHIRFCRAYCNGNVYSLFSHIPGL